ncbi:MAG TPA: hypothetical protein PKI05_06495 [Thermogutta sp.]|nr:hypothetical protein [Thermogutta sp.]HOP77178.1 hypothetical protein [Thermogutta sp.]HPZ82636.1 hypothetical protein [Thermogutta sp.]HQF14040.1 hypothetical protein [Thermogutta sp.]
MGRHKVVPYAWLENLLATTTRDNVTVGASDYTIGAGRYGAGTGACPYRDGCNAGTSLRTPGSSNYHDKALSVISLA